MEMLIGKPSVKLMHQIGLLTWYFEVGLGKLVFDSNRYENQQKTIS